MIQLRKHLFLSQMRATLILLTNYTFFSLVSYFLSYISNYFANCRISSFYYSYHYKMKTDLKTDYSCHNNGRTETCCNNNNGVDPSSPTSQYESENKENSAYFYKPDYTWNKMIASYNQNNSIKYHDGKPTETLKNGLKPNVCQTPEIITDSTKTTNILTPQNTQTPSSKPCMVSKHVGTVTSKDMMSHNIIKKMPVNHSDTRCPDRADNTNGRQKYLLRLKRNIAETVRCFSSWWNSGYVHKPSNSFNYSPFVNQNRDHLVRISNKYPIGFDTRLDKETGYISKTNNFMPNYDNQKMTYVDFNARRCHPLVGKSCYPTGPNNCRWASQKRSSPHNNKKAIYWSKYNNNNNTSPNLKNNRNLFEKTHWFREPKENNYKVHMVGSTTRIEPSPVKKLHYSTQRQLEVCSVFLMDKDIIPEPELTLSMSPVSSSLPSKEEEKCQSPSNLTSYTNTSANNHQEEEEIISRPEKSPRNYDIFFPTHGMLSGDPAVDTCQMLEVGLPQEDEVKNGRLEIGPDDDYGFGITDCSSLNVGCGPLSEEYVEDEDLGLDRFSEEEEEEEENSSGYDDDDLYVFRCPSPPPLYENPGPSLCNPELSCSIKNDDDSDSQYDEDDDDHETEEESSFSSSSDDDDLEVDGGGGGECCLLDNNRLRSHSECLPLVVDNDFLIRPDCEDSDVVSQDGGDDVFRCPSPPPLYEKPGPSLCNPELSCSINNDDDSASQYEDDDDQETEEESSSSSDDDGYDDDLEVDGGGGECCLLDNNRLRSHSECLPLVVDNGFLIRPDCDDSDVVSQDGGDDDDWESCWSSGLSPVDPSEHLCDINPCTQSLFFSAATTPSSSPLPPVSCSTTPTSPGDVPSVDDEQLNSASNNLQKLKETNERWNKVYHDDDDDRDFTLQNEEGNNHKQVKFASGKDLQTRHLLVCWSFAYQSARKGPWISLSLDSMRFRKRINELKSIIDPVLDPAHRHKVLTLQAAEST